MVRCLCDCTLTCYDVEVEVPRKELAEDEAAEKCYPDIADDWQCTCTRDEEEEGDEP